MLSCAFSSAALKRESFGWSQIRFVGKYKGSLYLPKKNCISFASHQVMKDHSILPQGISNSPQLCTSVDGPRMRKKWMFFFRPQAVVINTEHSDICWQLGSAELCNSNSQNGFYDVITVKQKELKPEEKTSVSLKFLFRNRISYIVFVIMQWSYFKFIGLPTRLSISWFSVKTPCA